MHRHSIKSYILLIIAFLIYSCSGVFSKLASTEEFLSIGYLKFFFLLIASLAVYAVMWQLILKRIQLSQAFLCKSMTVVFSLMLAHFFFGENISLKNMLGAALIVTGIVLGSQTKETV